MHLPKTIAQKLISTVQNSPATMDSGADSLMALDADHFSF